MTRTLRRAWHRRRTAVLLATATIAASFGWALAPGPSSSAQTPDPPFTVEVSQTSGLVDGDVVDVTVRAAPGASIQNESTNDLYICRPGVSYTSGSDLLSSAGNCPSSATSVSTSSEGSAPLYTLADGSRAEGDITVGTGVAEWSPGFGLPNTTLECGPGAPCLLVVKVPVSVGGGATSDHIGVVELSFTPPDPNAGCGSRNPAAVASAGSDRTQDLWGRSTLAQCQSAGSGASTQFAPRGEGEGMAAFAGGDVDLAYTASGYRPVRGFDIAAQRPAVYTPVALNAVVIATLGGGEVITDDPAWPVGRPRPYSPPIRLTAAEAATLLGQGQFFLSFSRGADVIARNPQLAAGLYQQTTKYTNPVALQDPTSVSLFMTSFLDSVAPDAWISGPATEFAPRGIDAQLGVATPGFESALTPISSQSQLGAFANVDVRQTVFAPQPGWALTDYATAVELGLQPVAIENAAGEFVLPTPESIAAGASTMTLEADGRRVPDPQAASPGAYPLTMVEYAMAPAEVLVDGGCAPRPAQQAVLSSWLSFLTGPGQAALGDGFVPLTSELAAQAEQAIAQVGASPSTAVCTPAAPGGPGTGTGAPGPGATPTGAAGTGSTGSGSRAGAGTGNEAGLDAGALSGSTPAELAGAAELADAAEPSLPPFLGIAAVSELLSPIALLLVVVLTSGAAFVTSGRPAPPAVASGARRVRARAGRAVRRVPFPRRG